MDEKARFVTQHKACLIQNVSTVLAIVESLGNVHPEIYDEIHAERTSRGQMRILYSKVLDRRGPSVKAAFYEALKQHQPHLLEEDHGPCLSSATVVDLHPESDATQFVDKYRRSLIQEVKNVQPILDLLLEKEVISHGDHADLSKCTSQDTMRKLLINPLLNSNRSKEIFYQALDLHENPLVHNIYVVAEELAKKNSFMIWSLIFAIVGTILMCVSTYISNALDQDDFITFLVGCLICSCGLMVAFVSLPDFYQLPRSSLTAKIAILCCKALPLKCPKAAGILFLVSSCYTSCFLLIWIVFYLDGGRGLAYKDYRTIEIYRTRWALTITGWSAVPFTLLAGILYMCAYGTLSCCCCSKGTGQRPGARHTAETFVDKHRRLLIQKVKHVEPILDLLLENEVITQMVHDDLSNLSMRTGQDTMRKLYELLKSNRSKQIFYQALEMHEKPLVDNIDVEAKELAKRDRFMILSLFFAIVGTILMFVIDMFSRSYEFYNAFVAGSVICSCGLVVAFRSLPDFYQLPRIALYQVLCCESLWLKCPKAAGIWFLVSSCYIFSATVSAFLLGREDDLVTQITGWFAGASTLLAGIFYLRAYGKPSCCCCSKGTGQKPGALQTSTMGEMGEEEELVVIISVDDAGEVVASP